MKINGIIFFSLAIILPAICYSQEKKLFLSAQISSNKQYLLGNNIYAKHHFSSHDYRSVDLEVSFLSKAFLGFQYCDINHKSSNDKYILSYNTEFNQGLFLIGYHMYFNKRVKMSPSFNVGIGYGENDTTFKGFVLGCGLQATFKLWKGVCLFTKSDFSHFEFDIKSTRDLEPLFDHTNGITIGGGIRYEFKI